MLEAIGVDWRVAFAISVFTALSALPFLPRRVDVAQPGRHEPRIAGRLVRSAGMWRLAALYVAAVGVPVTLSAWLVHYLTVIGDDTTTVVAGFIALLLFAAAGAARFSGGRFEARGASETLLTGAAALVAAIALAAFTIDLTHLVVVLPAVVLIGVGCSLPYVSMVDQAERLFPRSPLPAISFMSLGGNWFPAPRSHL